MLRVTVFVLRVMFFIARSSILFTIYTSDAILLT